MSTHETETEAEKKLRFLCSPYAEGLSDYQRINRFITAGMAVLAEINMRRRKPEEFTGWGS